MSAPARGALVWTTFDPSLGHEQGGRRPALVISNTRYNAQTGLMICLPVTSRIKGYSSEIMLSQGLTIAGVVLTSHVYTMAWEARKTEHIEFVPDEVLVAVLQRLAAIILQ